jgi:hypothetical protein
VTTTITAVELGAAVLPTSVEITTTGVAVPGSLPKPKITRAMSPRSKITAAPARIKTKRCCLAGERLGAEAGACAAPTSVTLARIGGGVAVCSFKAESISSGV